MRSNMIRKARNIGEVFDLNGQKFKVIKGNCDKCHFLNVDCYLTYYYLGACKDYERLDGNDVAFQLVEEEE